MMGREGFAAIAERTLEDQASAPPSHGTRALRMTSGTSGGTPLVFVREIQETVDWFTGNRSIVVCGGDMTLRLVWALYFKNESNADQGRILVLDSSDTTEELRHLFADMRPDMFVGFPSSVAKAAEALEAETGAHVRSIIMTGEPLRGSIKEFFESKMPSARIWMQYRITEIGYVSTPAYCPHLPPGKYHPASGMLLHIADPDENGIGELCVTTMVNGNIKLDGYHYGDLARITYESCPCGADTTFEIVGRSGHDHIRFAGATLRRDEFDRVLLGICGLKDYRAELSSSVQGGRLQGILTIHVRSDRPWNENDSRELAEKCAQELFVSANHTLGDMIASGTLAPLVIKYSKEPFEAKIKDIKLRYRDTV